jgi:subtilisin family serine protease
MKRYEIKLILIIGMILGLLWPVRVAGLENNPGANESGHSSALAALEASNLPGANILPDGQVRKNGPNFINGELLIKFKQEPVNGKAANMAPVQALNSQVGILKIEKVFTGNMPPQAGYSAPAYSSEQQRSNDLSRWYKLTIPKDTDVTSAVAELKNSAEIEAVEPNYVYQITTVPNDNYMNTSGSWGQSYQDLWGLYKISAPTAWDIETGSNQVVVAVVDTGLDMTHPDIANNIWINKDEIAGNHIDDDSNSYADDVNGWNFVGCSADVKDGHGHGTHVSGIIAAAGNNGIGISGVTWNIKIMPLKALNDDGYGVTGDLARAIRYAADKGARVINMSWGGRSTSQLVIDALDYAYGKGCVLVVAAGNSNMDALDFFPANYVKAITVAATGPDDTKASFSNYGDLVDVAAPGVDILSLRASGTDMYKDNNHTVGSYYYRASGTSMATPYVSGLAALILSMNSGLSNDEVTMILTSSTDDLGTPGKDSVFGYGRINAYKAIELADGNLPMSISVWATDTPNDSGHSITVFWNSTNVSSIVKGYKIYYSLHPFSSIYENGVSYYDASPSINPDAASCVVTGLGDESNGYYFAVMGNIFNAQAAKTVVSPSLNTSAAYISTTQPVYPVNNIINTTAGDEIMFSGNDLLSNVLIPKGTNNGKVLDVIVPASEIADLTKSNGGRNAAYDYLNPKSLEVTSREFKSSAPIEGKLRIMISYPADVPANYENKLKIYQMDTLSGQWKLISGIQSVNTTNKTVVAEADGSNWDKGIDYRLFVTLAPSGDLNEVRVYPNPYKPNSGLGHSKITFDNLTDSAKIKIFNIAGELVRSMEEEGSTGRKEWDATNDNSERLASGVYIYLITADNGSKKIGKLAIIR